MVNRQFVNHGTFRSCFKLNNYSNPDGRPTPPPQAVVLLYTLYYLLFCVLDSVNSIIFKLWQFPAIRTLSTIIKPIHIHSQELIIVLPRLQNFYLQGNRPLVEHRFRRLIHR